MYNTTIGKFCAEHNNWRELLVEEPYYIKIKEDGPYTMFSHDQYIDHICTPTIIL